MSRTYTTVELLEKIQVGQEAEMIAPVTDVVIKSTAYGIIVVRDANSTKHIGQPMPLSPTVLNATWKIVMPKITFEEAVRHIRNGRRVICEVRQDGITKSTVYDSMDDIIHIFEAVDGQWYLEV